MGFVSYAVAPFEELGIVFFAVAALEFAEISLRKLSGGGYGLLGRDCPKWPICCPCSVRFMEQFERFRLSFQTVPLRKGLYKSQCSPRRKGGSGHVRVARLQNEVGTKDVFRGTNFLMKNSQIFPEIFEPLFCGSKKIPKNSCQISRKKFPPQNKVPGPV